jgi:large subunit ribosomal protein L18
MATKKTKPLKVRHLRLRKKVAGTRQRPRLSVHFSGQHIYAQVIDDEAGKTIAAVNTTEGAFTNDRTNRANTITAKKVGKLVADRAKVRNVTKVVFDRGGFIYHGKVKALADAAREGGLEF